LGGEVKKKGEGPQGGEGSPAVSEKRTEEKGLFGWKEGGGGSSERLVSPPGKRAGPTINSKKPLILDAKIFPKKKGEKKKKSHQRGGRGAIYQENIRKA